MEPQDLCIQLRGLAAEIDLSYACRRTVASRIASLLMATDKSLALTVREAVHAEIEKLLPGKFASYDTNADGKGFRAGYVSFGLVPLQWQDEGIIGGILIQCDYNPKDFRSEAPETADPQFQHSKGGGIVELAITGCYYNKMAGQGCDSESAVGVVPLGGADVYVDAKEQLISVDIVDPGMTKAGLEGVIKDISSSPPDYAQSEKRKKKNRSPTGSPQSLLAWLTQQQRSSVGKSEIEALARAQSAKGGKAVGNAIADITSFFTSRGWSVDPNT